MTSASRAPISRTWVSNLFALGLALGGTLSLRAQEPQAQDPIITVAPDRPKPKPPEPKPPVPTPSAKPKVEKDSGFGVHAGAAIPQGDIQSLSPSSKPNAALGYGVHYFLDLGHGHGARARIDTNRYKTPMDPVTGLALTQDILNFGGDYLFFFRDTPRGVYLLAGVNMARVKETVDTSNNGSFSATKTRGSFAGGGGYQLGRLGFEVRYTTFANDSGGGTKSVDTLGILATWRF